jgi:hypothetical protein
MENNKKGKKIPGGANLNASGGAWPHACRQASLGGARCMHARPAPRGRWNTPGGTPAGKRAVRAAITPGRPHVLDGNTPACMQSQACSHTSHAATGDGAGTRVKAVVSDHAPLRGGRGFLAPRGPRATGLQASGPSFVSSSTKFNS